MSAGPAPTRAVARVLVDSPLPQLDRLFDYAVPDSLATDAVPGVRVRVPLRSARRVADGYLVEVGEAGDHPGPLSELEAVVSPARVLSAEVWALARRVADRAAGSASDVLRLAVPKRQVRVEKAWLAAAPSAGAGPTAGAVPGLRHPDPYASGRVATAVRDRARLAVGVRPLLAEVPGRDGGTEWVGEWAVTLARGAAAALASGGSAILCVPDHRDQRQLELALAQEVPAHAVVTLDARQSGPDRYRGFLACLDEEPRVIVGNRSAVYAPARRLALLALWDDGDPLHAEPLAPYVHARDAALMRQELQHCALWFAAHARSTEVERLLELGYLAELEPERRYAPRVLPTAQQSADAGPAALARIPSAAWREARRALTTGPVLVQVARPGYAPRLTCAECGETARCRRCRGPLIARDARGAPSCGWCGALAADWSCTNCDGTVLRRAGHGATRTAEELGRAFPGVRVLVADGERTVLTVDAEPALVVATRGAEPIAAGGYRAVLLLDGERMLARESLRVGEDCLRWWTGAAALAAPRAPIVLVGVGGALARAMVTWRPGAYAAAELADRRGLRFPPAIRVATVTGRPDAVDAALEAVAADGVDVLGPVEADDGAVRAILRFDYAVGRSVAGALRTQVIRAAASRRRRAGSPARGGPPTLRVHLDDALPFSE